MHTKIQIQTQPYSLNEFTDEVHQIVRDSSVENGMCHLFIQHTSASLLIQENADPSAKHDLEMWFRRLVDEADPNFTHTLEGADDMPSHIKSALTQTSLSIPIIAGELALGTWQGIYLWEHRAKSHNRQVIISIFA
jgi:secondary thiamine-phosphate synthase enzyme